MLLLLCLAACAGQKNATPTYRAVGFGALPGWQQDDAAAALAAFQRSCVRLKAMAPGAAIGPYGKAADWQSACVAANTQNPASQDAAGARSFFEANFVPVQVRAGRNPDGLFTGYYEPELKGARLRTGEFQTPLLARPPDLVSVDLGQFRPTWRGQRVAGKVSDGKLVPYADRRQIESEFASASPLRKPLLFVDDPVDAFFMEIQGSGRIRFADGSVTRLTFDGQNGFPYTAIGKVLITRGALPKERATMQGIRSWLAQNPGEAVGVMNENASYIFFREAPIADPALGPPGAETVPLTPGRSLAVDLAIHGMGMPVYVATEPPAPGAPPFTHLMIAQDTGGAIVGAVRGDVFFGSGPQAGEQAGGMKAKGQMFVLLPSSVADSLLTR
jgi:membrane-bound lytic murein transglycosylase A